jgi:ketosteroid isomerase-like protein
VRSKNVDRVRRWVTLLDSTLENVQATVEEFCEPDVDYYPVAKWPEARPCHGREEIAQFLARFLEAWLRYEWESDDLIPVGEDRVLACLNLRAEGRESGMNLEGDLYQCLWLRHGRFFRIEDHLTLSGALHALGLEGDTLEAAGLRAPSNVDLLRSIYADWERGDFSSMDWADPEIEYIHADGPARGTWTGLAGMAEGWRSWLSAWEGLHVEVDEYRELDDDRVLVVAQGYARGKTSGLETGGRIRSKAAALFHFRAGRVARLVIYFDIDRAFSELGFSPDPSSSYE